MVSDTKAPEAPVDEQTHALLAAVQALLAPLARLAVAHGLRSAALEELLRRAMVQAAAELQPQQASQRSVSRVSTATGIHRREVARLMLPAAATPARARSAASEVFAHWLGQRAYRDRDGAPRELPRSGPAPSFESLAQSVTRDVHPRSLLDELLRLKLAVFDERRDTVSLLRDGFVPSGDRARLLGYLSDNVGDHLAAAVDNVLGDGRRHFEQAVYADGLSAASVERLHGLVGPLWRGVLDALVPPLQSGVEADAGIAPGEQRRVRIGLYAYDEGTPDAARSMAPPAAAAPKRRPRHTPTPRTPRTPRRT